MAETILLVPVQFPVTADGARTVSRALELARRVENPHLSILHVNLIQNREDVTKIELQRTVEKTMGRLPTASYHVRDAYLLEDAILNETRLQNAAYVIIGHSRRARWRRWLGTRLGTTANLESVLPEQLDAEVVVVS